MVFVKNCKFLQSLILIKVAYNYFFSIFWIEKKGSKAIKTYFWKRLKIGFFPKG